MLLYFNFHFIDILYKIFYRKKCKAYLNVEDILIGMTGN